MSSRDKILNRIEKNKPALVPLPDIDINAVSRYDNVLEKFGATLNGIGGTVIEIESLDVLKNFVAEKKESENFVINTIDALGEVNIDLNTVSKEILNTVDCAFLKAELAVAENGAVWLYEHQMKSRLLPFICQHLFIVVDKNKIVATMHQAYQQIDTAREGFGAFVAGPSKTADIEQSLVIGAHGARSLTVYVI